ncbi:MAG: undecaprenyl/decaprenyl-phosphate alpha-N-acetylglucosaminyl 1-phosphate transferase [Bacteroidales bacterium]|nr:undecaprenyl/decaprenyl-phosphate alpha-N-acetylglucosaminyl 1-phosphate transferase [Bacteroidales bacterium]
MGEKILFLIISFVVNIFFLFYFRKVEKKINLIKLHKNITRWRSNQKPIYGGFIFITGLLISLLFIVTSTNSYLSSGFYNFLISLFFIFILGLADDFLNINAFIKIFIQAIIVIFVLSKSIILNLFEDNVVNVIITALFILWFVNACNMLDNIDGLLGTIAILFCIVFLLFYLNNYVEFYILGAFFVSCVVFLSQNIYPAKVYLGDNGSYFIGFFLCYFFLRNFSELSLHLTLESKFLYIYLFLVIPFTDSFTVIINRILRNKSPFIGGKDHTSHLLINKGIKEKYVPFLFAFINLIGIVGALSLVGIFRVGKISQILIIICCIFVTIYLAISDYLYYNKNKRNTE